MDPMPIVVPVRFSGGGLSMQTTSSRMALEAVFVRCLVAPKQGAEISLQITLPEDVLPVQIKGTVTETVPIGSKGKEAGFWAKLGADPRLEAFLRKKAGLAPVVRPPPQAQPPAVIGAPAAPQPQPQTRVFPRLRSRLKVSWSGAREFLVSYSENISR